MPTLREELTTIRALLLGSPHHTKSQVQEVEKEFGRCYDAFRLSHSERKKGLQILFFSRAIDTMLDFAVHEICTILGIAVPTNVNTIGQKINFCNNHRLFVNLSTVNDLEIHVRDKRNQYLHQAGQFPTDQELEMFLLATAIGIQEIISGLR